MKKLFMLIIFISTSQLILGQSTDRTKAYIVLDISGSTKSSDPNAMLIQLFANHIDLIDKKIQSPSTDIYVFGSDTYFLVNSKSKKPFKSFSKELKTIIDSEKSRFIQFFKQKLNEKYNVDFNDIDDSTDVREVLKEIKINADTNNVGRYSVYLYTDNILNAEDIPENDLSLYLNPIKEQIRIGNYTGNPVFLTQVVADSNEIKKLQTNTDSLLYSEIIDNHFFVEKNSKIDLNIIKNVHEDFIIESMSKIYKANTYTSPSTISEKVFAATSYMNVVNNDSVESSEENFDLLSFIKESLSNKGLILNLNNNHSTSIDDLKMDKLEDIFSTNNYKDYTNSLPNKITDEEAENGIKALKFLIKGRYYERKQDSTFDSTEYGEASEWIESLTDDSELAYTLQKYYIDFLEKYNLEAKDSTQSMQIMPPIGLFKVNQTKSLEQIQEKPRADDFQEALINGVSDYLVNRAKQEIFFSFLEKFEKNYRNNQALLTDTLFYNFIHLIRNLDERIPSTLQIKHALEEDIKQLPYNLIRRDTTRQRNEGIILLYYNIELIKNLAASKSIEKSFGELVIDSLDPNTKYTDVEKLLLLTAETFSFIEKYNYIAIYSKLDESSLSRFSRYLGYYLIEKYGLQDKIDNPKILYSHLVTLFQHYHELTLKMHELNSMLSSFSPSEDYDGYRDFRKDLTVDIFISATNILIEGLTLLDEFKPKVDESKPKVDQSKSEDTKLKAFEAKRLAQHGVDAYFAFKEGNYLQGINLLSPILFDTTLFTSKTPYLEKEVYEPLLFATEIATAKSSQEVSEIMSRYALPVASYRIKARKNTFMINSYLGASLTHYTTQDIKKKIMNINAPIGLEFSLPRRKCKIIRNISLFAPIIDFGNIISASLDEENDKEVRNPNYEQIFSPGGYLVFGISNDFPLSVGIGYQVNPGRIGFFVGIDMPLFSFY